MEEESPNDRLSSLPDDVLVNIVDRLGIADAARTGILSTRWEQIPSMLSKIVITFYLGDESIDIGRTVDTIISTQNVGSVEFTILTKKDMAKAYHDDLVAYGRQLSLLVNACPNAFGGLARLKLENLRLGESGFPKIFSICKGLELLRLYNCDMGELSLLEVEHTHLGELKIVDCDFERVDLKWLPMLTLLNFSNWISLHDPLSFGYVPLLQTLSIGNEGLSFNKMLKLSEFFGKVTISDLTLDFKGERIWIKPEGPKQLSPVFHKLRLVNLIDISEECDITWTMFILEGAPSLKELCITVRYHTCGMITNEEWRKKLLFSQDNKDKEVVGWESSESDFKHHNLAVLRVFGFQALDKFVSYVRSVMDAAVNLEDIHLYKPSCKLCKCFRMPGDKYPWTAKQRYSARERINVGKWSSLVRIHIPSSTRSS